MSYGEQPAKKSSGLKILLWILGIGFVLVLLACGGVFLAGYVFMKQSFITDPPQVVQTAESITEISPPAGYDPMFAMNIAGMKWAMFGTEGEGKGEGHVLMLMGFPAGMGVDEAQMRRQMEQSMSGQGQSKNLQVLETEERTYTIRGEETMVKIAKAQGGDEAEFRQITAIFKSKDGTPAMMMMVMPEEEWSSGGEEAFEQTIRSMQ